MDFLDELKWRGLVKDVTNFENLKKRLETPVVLYCGFDPTADSLHVGHLQQLVLLKRYQMQGHHPIALVGGATGMIGDPRPTTERSMLTEEDLQKNVKGIGNQIESVLSSDNNPVKILNNRDWLGEMTTLDFLRDYGKYFSVSNMLAKDTIAKRLSTGISFTEFTYTILQSIDFLHLYKEHNVELQIGGSDQWGNLVSGTDLIRKIEGSEVEVYGITSHLIMKADGTKFGKSEGQNIWLDPERTDAYTFYQFFINTSDEDVMDFMRRLSFKSYEEIMEIEASFKNEPHLRLAQKELAKELTELVHGKEGLDSAMRMTEALFSGDVQNLSVSELKQAFAGNVVIEVNEDKNIVEMLVDTKIISSKREARELIQGGAIRVNGEVVKDLEFMITKDNAIGKEITVIRRGKKTYHLINHVL
ncbi:tyrosine--tRNA ligase [Erysipelothrix inopinata]|uniref:Tyrosine--tRNA ligase n=1 Tax=Erysipelothrix inopinata TaxID=225084 RepID=A0A7G9RYD6_9FIRM|nr:tyrosine--tRNA ligase [Erysipelothrix inopinata]QNN60611.1 tyrosine--tRNA ligase [Erysipelothrix inopinata]